MAEPTKVSSDQDSVPATPRARAGSIGRCPSPSNLPARPITAECLRHPISSLPLAEAPINLSSEQHSQSILNHARPNSIGRCPSPSTLPTVNNTLASSSPELPSTVVQTIETIREQPSEDIDPQKCHVEKGEAKVDPLMANPQVDANITSTDTFELTDCMQIDSPDISILHENLLATKRPSNSPEIPLLETFCRPKSPDVKFLSARSVRATHVGSHPTSVQPQPLASTTSRNWDYHHAKEASLPSTPFSCANRHLSDGENGLSVPGVGIKRSHSPEFEISQKKPRSTGPRTIIAGPSQNGQHDKVERMELWPAQSDSSDRQSPLWTSKRQQSECSISPMHMPSARTASTSTYSPSSQWRREDYMALVRGCYLYFPFEEFYHKWGKSRTDVDEVFRTIILTPLLSRSNMNDELAQQRRKLEQDFETMRQQYRETRDRDMQREREQVRQEERGEIQQRVEVDVWRKMSQDGWMKLEEAKNIVAEREKQIEEANKRAQQKGRRGRQVPSVEETTAKVQDACAELAKAKKAEAAKVKRMQKLAEGSGSGRSGKKGKFDDDTFGKPGPKPGYGPRKGV